MAYHIHCTNNYFMGAYRGGTRQALFSAIGLRGVSEPEDIEEVEEGERREEVVRPKGGGVTLLFGWDRVLTKEELVEVPLPKLTPKLREYDSSKPTSVALAPEAAGPYRLL